MGYDVTCLLLCKCIHKQWMETFKTKTRDTKPTIKIERLKQKLIIFTGTKINILPSEYYA